MTPEDHQELTECYRAALALVVHGYPHSTDGSREFWHEAAQMTLTTFKRLLAKYDPHQTSPALIADDTDRGAN